MVNKHTIFDFKYTLVAIGLPIIDNISFFVRISFFSPFVSFITII